MQNILPLASSNSCLFPYINSVAARERTHCTSVTKVDQIIPFRKIIALYYVNQRNINYTLWEKCVDSWSSNGQYISHHYFTSLNQSVDLICGYVKLLSQIFSRKPTDGRTRYFVSTSVLRETHTSICLLL